MNGEHKTKHTGSGDTSAPEGTLSFAPAGMGANLDGERIVWVADRHEPDGTRRLYFLRMVTNWRIYEGVVTNESSGFIRLLEPSVDVSPLDGFTARIDLSAAPSIGRHDHALSLSLEELERHVHELVREVAPDLDADQISDLSKHYFWSSRAVASKCRTLSRLTRPRRKDIAAWEGARAFQAACIEAATHALRPTTREVLEGAGSDYGDVWSAFARGEQDLSLLAIGSRPRPTGLPPLDKSLAASFLRLLGESYQGLAYDQCTKATKIIESGLWRRDPPDLLTMRERVEEGARSMEKGKKPRAGRYPSDALVKNPPALGFGDKGGQPANLVSLGISHDGSTLADEIEQACEADPLLHLQAEEALRELRATAVDGLDRAIVEELWHWTHGTESELARDFGVAPSTVGRRLDRMTRKVRGGPEALREAVLPMLRRATRA